MASQRASTRYNCDWMTNTRTDGYQIQDSEVHTVLLQEIRDQLKRLNVTFDCYRFQQIPQTLKAIDRELKTIRKAQAKGAEK